MAQALHYLLCQYTQTRIISLALSGIPEASILLRRIPVDRDLLTEQHMLPAITISPTGRELLPAGTKEDTDVDFPVLVTIIAANNQDYTLSEPELKWREQIIDGFLDRQVVDPAFDGLCTLDTCQVEPYDILDATLWHESNLAVGGVLLRFYARKARAGTQ